MVHRDLPDVYTYGIPYALSKELGQITLGQVAEWMNDKSHEVKVAAVGGSGLTILANTAITATQQLDAHQFLLSLQTTAVGSLETLLVVGTAALVSGASSPTSSATLSEITAHVPETR
jgi:hypothetical protein